MIVPFDPSTKHPLYQKWMPKWFRQRCLIEGQDRIKEHDVAVEFLPRLEGQGDARTLDRESGQVPISSYESYKERAVLFNATGRTREGLVGAIMRKDPHVSWTGKKEDLEHLGHGLESLNEIISQTLDEMIGVGRYGQLVDMPAEDVGEDHEPFVAEYHGEAITDWEEAVVKGRKRTTRINLKERSDVDDNGTTNERYRILWLGTPQPRTVAEGKMLTQDFLAQFDLKFSDFRKGPIYFQEIWVEVANTDVGKSSGKKKWVREQLIVPKTVGGRLWDEIPFTFYNAASTRAKPDKPMLLDITVVNIGHYRNSADKEHGLHFTGLPQPWLAGFKFKNHLFIGSGAAWVAEDPQAKAGYLEVQGDFKALTEEMDRKEKRMAVLGGQLLEEQTPAGSQEAMGTVKMRQSGKMSVLSRASLTASEGLTNTLRLLRRFKGDDSGKASIQLNLDFGVEALDPQMLTALMASVQQGMMSWDTYAHNLKRGELYPEDWDKEKEAAAIQVGIPGRTLDDLLNPKMDADGAVDDDSLPEPKKPKKAAKKKPAKAKAAA